jgi:FkbM family methyltransferase
MYKNKLKSIARLFFSRQFILSIKNLLSNFIDIYSLKSYSQEGEDMILRRMFDNIERGFYVDVGANHPKRFSNTYFFYKKGWSGINIDSTPGSMKLFQKFRPRDINIEAAIAKEQKQITFFMFDDPALNTFDESSIKIINSGTYQIINKIKLTTQKLSNLLSINLPKSQKIDFLSIDVEGLDLEVLESNDWSLFRPKCVLIEQRNLDITNLQDSHVYQFLDRCKYKFIAKTFNTLIFQDMQ